MDLNRTGRVLIMGQYEFIAQNTSPLKVQSPEDQATTEPMAGGENAEARRRRKSVGGRELDVTDIPAHSNVGGAAANGSATSSRPRRNATSEAGRSRSP